MGRVKVWMDQKRKAWDDFMHNQALKDKLNEIIFGSETPQGKLFDIILLGAIIFSILLVVLNSFNFIPSYFALTLQILEYLLTAFFTFEYLARLYCSPSPRKYALSFYGLVDLLATMPVYLEFFLPGSRYFMIIRTFRLIRVFRVFKLFSFLAEGNLLLKSLEQSMQKILVFFFFVVILVISLGTLMFMVEGDIPETAFTDIPTSIYWAIVTMTTVGYGDITPITALGRFLSAIVMLLGYTILAVPTGIVSAQMIDENNRRKQKRVCPHCRKRGHDDNATYCKHCGQSLSDNPNTKH